MADRGQLVTERRAVEHVVMHEGGEVNQLDDGGGIDLVGHDAAIVRPPAAKTRLGRMRLPWLAKM